MGPPNGFGILLVSLSKPTQKKGLPKTDEPPFYEALLQAARSSNSRADGPKPVVAACEGSLFD